MILQNAPGQKSTWAQSAIIITEFVSLSRTDAAFWVL